MKIADFCQTAAGGTPLKSNKEFYEGGKIPWLLSGEVGNKEIKSTKNFITDAGLKGSSAKIFPANTVVIAMYGATAGEVGILKFEAATNQAVCGIYPNDKIIPEYLYYFFLFNKEALVAQAVGNAQPNISQQKIKNTEIPLPCINEQKRIVAVLDQAFGDIDRVIDSTKQNLASVKELFDSYLWDKFSHHRNGWELTHLGKEIDLLTGFAFKSKEYVSGGNDIPLIRGDNIAQGELRWNGVKRWPTTRREEFAKYELSGNDLVLAMDRTWIKAGIKFAKISPNDLPALLVQRVARLRCLDSLYHGFLYHLIGSKYFENYVLSIQTGLGVPHISGKQIESFTFFKPSFTEQVELASIADDLKYEVQLLQSIYQEKLDLLKELKASILREAFSGARELMKSKGAAA
jgi:type I restriction enzyme S subunit